MFQSMMVTPKMDFHLDRDGFPGSPGKTAWPGFNWARYYPQFQALGGICELFVEGIRKHQRARHTVDGSEIRLAS